MGFDVLLEILRALEGFLAEVTFVRLEGNVNADMRGDVVALDRRGATGTPLAGQVEVVCAFAADMAFADVILQAGGWSAWGMAWQDTSLVARHSHRATRPSRSVHRSLATGR